MSDPEVELGVARHGPVLWLTIQRQARRNAMSHGVLEAMGGAIEAAQSDRDVRAIVVTGAVVTPGCTPESRVARVITPTPWPPPRVPRGPSRWSG